MDRPCLALIKISMSMQKTVIRSNKEVSGHLNLLCMKVLPITGGLEYK